MKSCTDCKHYVKYDLILGQTKHCCYASWPGRTCLVNGKRTFVFCSDQNPTGCCSLFERKIGWFKRLLKRFF